VKVRLTATALVLLGAAAAVSISGQTAAPDCAWTTRAFGSAAYHVVANDSLVAAYQRWDTALRRAVAEETLDPRREVQVRMAIRVECPIPAAPPEPAPVTVDSVQLLDVHGALVREVKVQEGESVQLCALAWMSDGTRINSCADTAEAAAVRQIIWGV
jgi:hypothetical protein